MKNSNSDRLRPTAAATPSSGAAEQLSLLQSTALPARFRLNRETRERGLRHVAEIREMLAANAATQTTTPSNTAPRQNKAA